MSTTTDTREAPPRDAGARKLTLVFFSVVAGLLCFYSYLAWKSLTWSPSFFIQNAYAGRSATQVDSSLPPFADEGGSAVARGRDLFRRVGCTLCHGIEGKGGVTNPNYAAGSAPALNQMAKTLLIDDPDDAKMLIGVIEAGKAITPSEPLKIPRAAAVRAKYDSVRLVILEGNPVLQKDPDGPPPIEMPSWKAKLTSRDIDCVIAYLVSLYPWETEEADAK